MDKIEINKVGDMNDDMERLLSIFRQSGLQDLPDYYRLGKLVNTQTNNQEVVFWKILSFLVGTRTIKKSFRDARQLLDRFSEVKEPRFELLRGLLIMSECDRTDFAQLKEAEACFLRASIDSTKEVLHCLGEIRYRMAIAKCDFDLESFCLGAEFHHDVRLARTIYCTEGLGRIKAWRNLLRSSYQCFYESYNLGSVEALLGIAKCILAHNRLIDVLHRIPDKSPLKFGCELMSLLHSEIGVEFGHASNCYKIAAEKGLAEGWELLHPAKHKCNCLQVKGFVKGILVNRDSYEQDIRIQRGSDTSRKEILDAWMAQHNISKAYYLSKRYNQDDALTHYISGVVHECGFCGWEKNGLAALREFEKALQSGSDELCFVKELAKDHLAHMGYIEGYEINFSYNGTPKEVLLYLEYEIERSKMGDISCDWYIEQLNLGKISKTEWSSSRERVMRGFKWWYSIRYAIAYLSASDCGRGRLTAELSCSERSNQIMQILLDSNSPEGLVLISKLNLYRSPLLIKANAVRNNRLSWLKSSTELNGGCSDGNYELARCLINDKCNMWRSLGDQERDLYDSEIVKRLKTASAWGHQKAEFDILMAARYGGLFSVEMTPEEIAAGFLRLMEKGFAKAGYEYAFCQYDQFGVMCDIKECYDGIIAAASVRYGYGRGREIYQEIWGPHDWEDDRERPEL